MSLYVTVAEFKNAPTAIDCSTLIPGGTQAQNDAELYNVLSRASSWVDKICNMQTLQATTNTEAREVRLNKQGLIRVFPDMIPIINLSSVNYRINPMSSFMTVDLGYIQTFERYFTLYNLNTTLVAPSLTQMLPSYGYYSPYTLHRYQQLPITIQYTYTNGYTNTYISGNVLAGAQTINIKDATGSNQGQVLTIYDSQNTEQVTVQSVNGNAITLVSPLQFAHNDSTPFSALPASVKQATILLATFLIKERGSLAVSMGESSLQGVYRYRDAADIDVARELLRPFIRAVNS